MHARYTPLWRISPKHTTNRNLTNRYGGQLVTTELLERIGPRCAVVVKMRPHAAGPPAPTVGKVVNFDPPIPYRLTDED